MICCITFFPSFVLESNWAKVSLFIVVELSKDMLIEIESLFNKDSFEKILIFI